jgi:hypothetical protein
MTIHAIFTGGGETGEWFVKKHDYAQAKPIL